MSTSTSATICLLLLLAAAKCEAQLGVTRQQLVARYGSCKPDAAGKPKGPNVSDGVIDVGTQCYFHCGPFRAMALFKSDRAVGFMFSKEPTFWDSLLHPFRYSELPLSAADISALLRTADPGTEWVAQPGDAIVRRWRTSDGSAAAYYFAGGQNELYHLLVYSAEVDEVFRRLEHY